MQEGDRIGFRISSELDRHERYNYLLNRLAPKPRKTPAGGTKRRDTMVPPPPPLSTPLQDGEQVKETAMSSSLEEQNTPTPTATPREGVEESMPSSNPEVGREAAINITPEQGASPFEKPSLVPPPKVEQDREAILHQEVEGHKETREKNLALCGTLIVRPRFGSIGEWKPPPVTHEFGYPSDEEIVPNPKADFRKTFLPRLGHVRSWFKGAEAEPKSNTSTAQEGARSAASCLPIMVGKGSFSDGDMTFIQIYHRVAMSTSSLGFLKILMSCCRLRVDLEPTHG